MDMEATIRALRTDGEAARRTTREVEGAKFSILHPTEHEMRCAHERFRDDQGRTISSAAMRYLLERAITGWSGVTTHHLGHVSAEAVPVPFAPDTLAMLLDGRQEIADELGATLYVFHKERADAIRAARKNSVRESSGS